MKPLRSILLLSFLFALSSCSSSEWSTSETRVVTGRVYVTGNDPFTKLAVQLDGGKVYILKCSGEVEKKIQSNQGRIMKITARGAQREPEGAAIEVLDAELVTQEAH